MNFVSVPVGWSIARLGDILPLSYGKSLVEEKRDSHGKIPVYGSSGLVGMHNQALVHNSAIIVGRKGNVGAVYFCDKPSWVIDTAYYTVGSEDLNLQFFQYLLTFLRLAQLDRSTAVPGLSRDDYNVVEVGVPPQPEQGRIVAEIEKQFTRLDAAVAALKRVRANLKRYRASVLKAACEGRLVLTEAELARKEGRSYETGEQLLARILKERRAKWEAGQLAKMHAVGNPPENDDWKQKYREPTPPDTRELSSLPQGWAWATIDQVSVCLDGQRIPVNKNERLRRGGDIPYYGANGQVGVINDYLFDEPLVLVVEDETFVGRRLPFSYLIKGKSWVNNHAHVLRATGAVSPEFLNYSLAFYPFTRLTTGSTGRRKLTQKALMQAPYPLPPIEEQSRIAAEVERMLSIEDEINSDLQADLERADRLRQSILKRAFEGKLVPQDPNDEPASVLLQRIRAEGESQQDRSSHRRARKLSQQTFLAEAK